MGGMLEVCMIGSKETPNGFQWKINCGQKSLVSIKSPCIIKVLAAGNRYKLHLSPCPGAPCLIKRMGFPLNLFSCGPLMQRSYSGQIIYCIFEEVKLYGRLLQKFEIKIGEKS